MTDFFKRPWQQRRRKEAADAVREVADSKPTSWINENWDTWHGVRHIWHGEKQNYNRQWITKKLMTRIPVDFFLTLDQQAEIGTMNKMH
jgi:hypothetical protein